MLVLWRNFHLKYMYNSLNLINLIPNTIYSDKIKY